MIVGLNVSDHFLPCRRPELDRLDPGIRLAPAVEIDDFG